VSANAALGRRLREARERRGWRLADVERISKRQIKASVLGAYERGERNLTVPKLYRLASFYGVSVLALLGEDAPPPPCSHAVLRCVLCGEVVSVAGFPGGEPNGELRGSSNAVSARTEPPGSTVPVGGHLDGVRSWSPTGTPEGGN
jgi:Helix-turn-helix